METFLKDITFYLKMIATPGLKHFEANAQWEIMSDLCHYLSWETMDVNYIFSHYKMFLEMYIEHCNPNALLNYLNKAKSSYYFSF